MKCMRIPLSFVLPRNPDICSFGRAGKQAGRTVFAAMIIIAFFTGSFAVTRASDDMVKDFAKDYAIESTQPQLLAGANPMEAVAQVGHGKILAYQVFELWAPIWSETQAKVRNGKMSPAEGDKRLHVEWERAVRALIKDELFYQEAEREHQSFMNSIVDRIMQGGADRPRNQMVTEVRRMMQQDMEKYFQILGSEVVKESGGMLKLHKVLEGRGITFAEWQNRLKKKAFTQSYLHQILKPRAPNPGPRQVQSYYSENTEEFSRPGTVKFRHIFFANDKHGGADGARDAAVEVWEKLMDEEIDFEDAARQFSDDKESREKGGLETEAESLDPEREAWLVDIRAALREETPGEIGAILESPFGCHLATLIAVGPPQKIPFNDVRRDIERKLTNRIWEAETDRYFSTIRKNTDIRVAMPTFPPELSCVASAGDGRRTARVYNVSLPGLRDHKKGGK